VILVTVGMHTDGFSRLVEEMDRIAGQIDEKVLIQLGNTAYRPVAAEWFAFATYEEMADLCEQARVIVSHAGAGSILTALRYHKPLIVVPRAQRYGEVVDDHQFELAEAMSEAGRLLMAAETSQLAEKLDAAAAFCPAPPTAKRLVTALRVAVVGDMPEAR